MRNTDRRKICELAQMVKNGIDLVDRMEAVGGLAAITEYLRTIGEITQEEYDSTKENLMALDSEIRALVGLKMSAGGIR